METNKPDEPLTVAEMLKCDCPKWWKAKEHQPHHESCRKFVHKGATAEQWTQERPSWCPHQDCLFKRRAMDDLCGGKLPNKQEHDGDYNTHRFCINHALPNDEVFDLQVNKSDLWWFEFIFEALKESK